MPLTISQRPNANNGWSAGFNPVVYKMQRKDYNITAVASSGGALQITVNANLATLTTAKGGAVVAGSVLWVTTDNGVYNGAYTVVTCTNAASSVVTFGAGTYTSAATTGYVNLQQRTAYNVQARIFAGNGAVSSSSLFTMTFTPSKSGALLMDVSPLRNYLSPLLFQYLSTTNNLAETWKVRQNTATSFRAHIQYTEAWTSSAETETSDSANPFFIVYGARQVGNAYGGYLKEYSDATGRKFLTPSATRAWLGKPFTLSFIDPSPSGTSRTHVKKTRYYSNGQLWGSTYDLSDYSGGTPNPSIFESFEDLGIHYALLYDKQDTAGTVAWSSTPYTGQQTITGTTGTSNNLVFPLYLTPSIAYSIVVNVTVTTGAATINLAGKELNGTNRFSLSQSAPVGTYDLTFSGTPTLHTHFIALSATFTTSSTITINSITVHDIPQNGRIEYQLVTLTSAYYPITETVVSETLVVQVEEACTPSVQLIWKNHLGGDQTFVFGYNQSFSISIKDKKKTLMKKLFADSVTYDELMALSELASIGSVYDTPIQEMTSTTIATQRRSGQTVYALDDSGKYRNRGDWATVIVYYPNDVVFYRSAQYVCLLINSSTDPDIYPLYWLKVNGTLDSIIEVIVTDFDFASDSEKERHSVAITIQYPETIHQI